MSDLLQRIVIVIPWIFIGWLIGRGISGEMDGLLVFVLVIILVPIGIFLNLLTIILFKGRQAIKMLKQMQDAQKKGQEPIKSDNYADLPWWNPKRWMN